MTTDSGATAGRPLLGRISFANLVWAQVSGLVVMVVALRCGLVWWGALALGIVVGLVLLLPLGKRTVSDWIATRGRFRARRGHPPADIIDFRAPDGRSLGLYWDGSRVVAVVEVLAPKGGLTRLGRSTVASTHLLPLPELAKSLSRHDILLSGIDVVSHGYRSRSGTPAGAIYESLLGPLPATAHRTVWLAIAFDPIVCPEAAARRGGGLSGACRAVTIATQRIVRTLEDAECAARLLTAPEIRQAALLVTAGVDPGELSQHWRYAELGNSVNIGAAVDPHRLASDLLAQLWVPASRGTTVAVRLRPGRDADTVRIGASWRLTARELPEEPVQQHMISMNGRHREGLLAHLPFAVPGLDDTVPTEIREIAALDALHLPSAGCGQLLGSDDDGNGVAIRLVGQGISSVYVAGELYLAQQLVFRALAVGERVLIRTDRPHAWQQLVTTIGNPDRLTVAVETHQSDADFTATVVDGVLAPAPHAGLTTIYLTGDPLGWPASKPDLSIQQPGATGNRITLRTGNTEVPLTLVSIPRESTYIGTPRAAAVFAR
ncbi:type VII secretion protein EccE [Nocardia seriolae]|uniref:type VII secretion protein EccE n=1 Tax=Nocardia seriolae TaxID=37332 RepID=UPI0012BCCA79|nr:type VII secretion protein EccE [Nocardia seriolae]MTJ61010.1 type VII secretion protein EccE [Nocardia seriolae]MTJ70528.1 type VII secretion protein EccE [Nocardia seriolae]MTJ90857.1 type VII secretion protein EccE [Nocardia seriolae]MTK34814.1 type VII secretion protein EccE [Nocardia seriolae]MTK38989.1 type VII secretion protein EccE [Nocardia seriolae]